MVSMLDSGLSGPSSSPVVLLGKTLHSRSVSPRNINEYRRQNAWGVIASHPGEQQYSQSLHATYRNRDKLLPAVVSHKAHEDFTIRITSCLAKRLVFMHLAMLQCCNAALTIQQLEPCLLMFHVFKPVSKKRQSMHILSIFFIKKSTEAINNPETQWLVQSV